MTTNGYFNGFNVSFAYSLRPIINLRADTLFSGDGLEGLPYKIISK